MLGRTQAEVKEKLKAAMAECQGLDVSREADGYTVATWLRTWYELYAKPNVRTATANRYQLIIETYTIPRIGDIQPKRFTIRHLQKLYKELLESRKIHSGKGQNTGLSTTTVRCAHLMLHAVLQGGAGVKTVSSMPGHSDVHPPHPYPRYEAEAGQGCPNHGRLHGASHVKRKGTKKCKSAKKHPKSEDFRCFVELLGGFEPPTSSLPSDFLNFF